MVGLDWAIVVVCLSTALGAGLWTRRYTKSVADFLAAGRAAGRYLVCNAEGTAALGAITFIALFEVFYNGGLGVDWWGNISRPVWLVISLSGFVIYRYRETRVFTLAQFFEVRYSRRFRVFMGLLIFVSGVLNYGIFPAVTARFIVCFCDLPEAVHLFGGVPVPTYPCVMAVILLTALGFTWMGGQLTVMVTDCIEGLISNVLFLLIVAALLGVFGWGQITEAMTDTPPGKSLMDPFDTFKLQDFNIWFQLISVFGTVYTYMAWQGNQGFNCSAASPHEAKMGRILGQWRGAGRTVMIVLVGICAYTYMHHADFAPGAAEVNRQLARIENPQIQEQMRVPTAMRFILPPGARGAFFAVLMLAMLACDSSYLHSWGSIFVQDVVLPFRKKPLEPRQHLFYLRCAIGGVALFAFIFSLRFRQSDYIVMYMSLTGALYLAGAGSAIIGGLYWARGSTAAAWASTIAGGSLAVLGLLVRQAWPGFPLNGQVISFFCMLAAIALYVIISLAGGTRFNMDRLLHRGEYARDEQGRPLPRVEKPPRSWRSLLGIDEQFTRGDRFIAIFLFAWTMLFMVLFIAFTAWNLFQRWPVSWWATYWHITTILIPIVMALITSVWFTWGGLLDLARLVRRLRAPAAQPAEGAFPVQPKEANAAPAPATAET